MKVRLIRPVRPDGRDERSALREDREYVVLAIECDAFRLLNEYGEPTLHDAEAFQLTDGSEPPFWYSVFEDGSRYAGPPDLRKPRLFEDWHDGAQEAIDLFEDVVRKYYPEVGDDLIPKRYRKAARNRPDCE